MEIHRNQTTLAPESERVLFLYQMSLEFDEAKSVSKLEKHGIDFQKAQQLWHDSNHVTFEARFDDESRFGLIAEFNEKLLCAIFTLRDDRIRLISVRRARDYETKLYNES
tara:strand:- start:365 stop:694 length:330 start_codon:yes stop_codon:yes gene_type:complete